MTNFTIPIPKSPFIEPKTGLISRDWYLFFVALFNSSGSGSSGSANQVLHGGTAGYAAVSLVNDVTGILASSSGGSGVSNFTVSGGAALNINVSGATNVTFPTSGLVAVNVGTIAAQNASSVSITGGSISGVTVSAIAVSSNAVQITGSTRLDNQVSTGAQTATFVATNKPGVGTTSPDKWLALNLDGTIHYIPCFL